MSKVLPQLDVTTYPTQILWTFLAFFLLYLFVSWIFVPRIAGPIKRRRLYLLQCLRKAQNAKNLVHRQRDRYLEHQQFLDNMYQQKLDELVSECQKKIAQENSIFEDKINMELQEQHTISQKRLRDFASGHYDKAVLLSAEKLIKSISGHDPHPDDLREFLKNIKRMEN